MKQVDEEMVAKVVGRIYRDTMVTQSKEYFITHVYEASQFENIVTPDVFHNIVGFFPNTKYRGKPFIMSVVFNKLLKNYEITVQNPSLNF